MGLLKLYRAKGPCQMQFRLSRSAVGTEICISSKLTGDAFADTIAAGPRPHWEQDECRSVFSNLHDDMHLPGGTNKNTAPQTPPLETLIQWVKDRCQRFLFFSRTLGNSSHQKIWDDIDLVQNLLMRERQTCG